MHPRTYTQDQYESLVRTKKFAWAKYFREVSNRANIATIIVRSLPPEIQRRGDQLIIPPTLPHHITNEYIAMATELNKDFTCSICLDLIHGDTIDITYCGHKYHKACLAELKDNTPLSQKPKCPECRATLNL